MAAAGTLLLNLSPAPRGRSQVRAAGGAGARAELPPLRRDPGAGAGRGEAAVGGRVGGAALSGVVVQSLKSL